MFRRFSANFSVLSILLDVLLAALSLFTADAARWRFNDLSFVQELSRGVHLPPSLYVIFPLIWISVFILFSVYDGRRNLRAVDEFASLTAGTCLSAISMAGVLYLSFRDVSRVLFIMFVVMAYLSMMVWRGFYRLVYRWGFLRGMKAREVLILGVGSIGRQVQAQILGQPYLGLTVTGFLDDDKEKQSQYPEVLGALDDVRQVISNAVVDDVVIALPRAATDRLNQVVSDLHDLPVRVWVVPDYFSLSLHRAAVVEFAGLPMMDLRAPALNEYQRIIKRLFDLLFVLAGLPFVMPLMGVVALAIRLDSPGPALLQQKRLGENGRLFDMYKFRTMVKNAESLRHLVHQVDENGNWIYVKRPDDPRVTNIGRFLRKTSLDELPQILNVIKGEMSLVGPRPELPELVDKYKLWQRKRFAIPQGMTGWWQVNGRSDKPMHLHTEDDLYYVQHYSIWLDLQILLMTIWVVFRGKGAY